MPEPLQSADKKYYASKTPLLIRGTREGRKSPRPSPSYKQKANDVTATSDKYYREMSQPDTKPAGVKLNTKSSPQVVLSATKNILVDIVAAIQQGATDIVVKGDQAAIVKARAAVDMAVGRNTLTRAQADYVSYITVILPVVEPVKVPVVKAEVVKAEVVKAEVVKAEVVKAEVVASDKKPKKSKKKAASKKAASKPSATTEADDILNPPEVDSTEVTEADIASAFGVRDNASDDDFNDDSDD